MASVKVMFPSGDHIVVPIDQNDCVGHLAVSVNAKRAPPPGTQWQFCRGRRNLYKEDGVEQFAGCVLEAYAPQAELSPTAALLLQRLEFNPMQSQVGLKRGAAAAGSSSSRRKDQADGGFHGNKQPRRHTCKSSFAYGETLPGMARQIGVGTRGSAPHRPPLERRADR